MVLIRIRLRLDELPSLLKNEEGEQEVLSSTTAASVVAWPGDCLSRDKEAGTVIFHGPQGSGARVVLNGALVDWIHDDG